MSAFASRLTVTGCRITTLSELSYRYIVWVSVSFDFAALSQSSYRYIVWVPSLCHYDRVWVGLLSESSYRSVIWVLLLWPFWVLLLWLCRDLLGSSYHHLSYILLCPLVWVLILLLYLSPFTLNCLNTHIVTLFETCNRNLAESFLLWSCLRSLTRTLLESTCLSFHIVTETMISLSDWVLLSLPCLSPLIATLLESIVTVLSPSLRPDIVTEVLSSWLYPSL